MRRKLDLDKRSLDKFSMLLHGPYGSGKTHLQGDFLRWAIKQAKGPVGYLTFSGQEGHATISSMGLGERGEEVGALAEYEQAVDEYIKGKYFALAVDGLHDIYRFVTVKYLGSFRYPDPKIDKEFAKMYWGQIKLGCYDAVLRSKAIPYVFWVSPHDKNSDDIEGGSKVGPDLPGRAATASVGWFDLVGHLTARTLSADRVERKVEVKQSNATQTRQRFPHEITQDIVIPANEGGWLAIYGAVQKAMGLDNSKKEGA